MIERFIFISVEKKVKFFSSRVRLLRFFSNKSKRLVDCRFILLMYTFVHIWEIKVAIDY